ncbi:hypothetical protein AJ87_32040 [Rhizobium yanglingense]|nr:hypothetical protein AJ87_32040 [Rhizobium yanglingense]
MAVALLVGINGAIIVQRPEIAAILLVAMAVPEVVHAMIDDAGGTRTAEKDADREAVDCARRNMNAANLSLGIKRLAMIVEIVKTALGIDRIVLEEIEKAACLGEKPVAVIGAGAPVSEPGAADCRCHVTPPISCTTPCERPI